jgi:sec-independent protein translocase protein TatA
MGSFSIWHWLVVLLVVLLLFGSGKVSTLMGDFAKGIKSFKKNMAEESDESMEAGADKAPGSIAPPAPQAGNTAGSTTATPPPRTTQKV